MRLEIYRCVVTKSPKKKSVGSKERCRKELSQAHPTEVTNKKMHHRTKCVRPRPEAERPPLPWRERSCDISNGVGVGHV